MERLPRWRMPRAGRRLILRWRASRLPSNSYWPGPQAEGGIVGIPRAEQQHAIETACRLFGVERAGSIRSGVQGRSANTEARSPDGTPSWLKLSVADKTARLWSHGGERAVREIGGIATPAILNEREWSTDGRDWHAFQFELAPSPAVQRTPGISAPMPLLGEEWFADFKAAMDRLSAAPLGRWLVHPGEVARIVAQRFGRRAPYDIDEWRMAHGDLNWSNITAPKFMLLDWERWGAAPRGYDTAMLLIHSVREPEIYRRIEQTFADDLASPSGVVARLYNIARRLNRIEAGFHDPREHAPLEREAKRLLRG